MPACPPARPPAACRTDYSTFALVQGAKDRSFVQVYSRTPNPGPAFIAEKKQILRDLGYPVEEIVDTPQVGLGYLGYCIGYITEKLGTGA